MPYWNTDFISYPAQPSQTCDHDSASSLKVLASRMPQFLKLKSSIMYWASWRRLLSAAVLPNPLFHVVICRQRQNAGK